MRARGFEAARERRRSEVDMGRLDAEIILDPHLDIDPHRRRAKIDRRDEGNWTHEPRLAIQSVSLVPT